MMEEWRLWLYYPLGIIPALAFASRYLVQWLASEKQGKSVVMPLFWHLSILGNLSLLLHAYIQLQFHVGLVQTLNGVISWRNLNIMGPKERHWKGSSVIIALFCALATLPALFLLTSYFAHESIQWFRSPVATNADIYPAWHAVGFLGLLLFNGRFWVQWWGVEQKKESYLGVSFWWMSVGGSFLCLLYFSVIGDIVNMVGPLFGTVPSIRNLILARRLRAIPAEG